MHNCIVPKVDKYTVQFSESCRRFLAFSLQIVEYGTVVTQTSDPHGEHFSFHHRLNYVLEGHPYYLNGSNRIDLEPGCLVYLPPNMTLEIDENSEIVKLYFINFTLGALDKSDDFNTFMNGLFINNHVHDRKNELRFIMEEIQRIGNKKLIGTGLEIQNLFENLFLHVVRLSNRYQEPHPETASYGADVNLNLAMNYINNNIRRNFSISEMAESLHISENYLYKIMVKYTGKSPAQFISDLRLNIAQSTLANSSIPIKTIGDRLGYKSSSHFSTAFKKRYGLSPMEYRKKLQGDRTAANNASHGSLQ